MTMPFQLAKRARPVPATALLLTTTDERRLIDLCTRVGADPWPRVVPVAGGFLLQLAAPTTAAFPGTVRLRALCENLLLPVDADLVPPLWDDERRGLVRDRGLIFLPGGRVLSFALDQPLQPSDLLRAPQLSRGDWQPFPEPPALAERLHEVRLELPPPPLDELFDAGGEGIGIEEPRPPASGPLSTVTNQAALYAGKGLFQLGQLLHLGPLARLGARWMQNAVERAPRLSEAVLGKQEAALRELLRLFNAGKIEEALRRALPLGGPGGRGGVAAQGSQLPWHQLFYSLANILGDGGGRAAIWYGGHNVQLELAQSYRRAAEAALQKGDFRRAAFIYGKLLRDYSAAARALYQGGLYRDAAVIYLTQLNDRRAAAGAYEAAGETDEALRLYRQLGDHVAAGDLLTRLGETDAALAEYRSAADRLAANQDWLAAGELLLLKAARHDLARELFERGWAARPANNAVPCALRLARLFQSQAAPTDFLALVRQARSYFDSPGIDGGAVEFYHTATRLAESGALSPVRDQARDAALIGLATKLRQRVEVESRPGDLVSQFLGRAGVFPAAVVSDARHAVKAAVRPLLKESQTPRPRQRQPLGNRGAVSAVCSAGYSGELFLAFHSGEVTCFRPIAHEILTICPTNTLSNVRSIAVDERGQFLVAAQPRDAGGRLSVFTRSPNGTYQAFSPVECDTPLHWVSPQTALHNNFHHVCLDGESGLRLLVGPFLTISTRFSWSNVPGSADCRGALLVYMANCGRPLGILFWSAEGVWFNGGPQPNSQRVNLSWNPSDLRDDPVRRIALDLYTWSNVMFEIAGIDDRGVVLWSLLRRNGDTVVEDATATAGTAHGYRAVAIVHQGRLAAVSDYRVDWLRYSDRRFVVVAQTPLDDGITVVAAFRSLPTRELLLVRTHGEVERLPLPPEVV